VGLYSDSYESADLVAVGNFLDARISGYYSAGYLYIYLVKGHILGAYLLLRILQRCC
jgi:hypothetical protein